MKKVILTVVLFAIFIVAKAQDTISIEKKIKATFDSYNVVVELDNSQQPLSKMDSLKRLRNVQHLQLMYSKEWFYNALTNEQKLQISNIVN